MRIIARIILPSEQAVAIAYRAAPEQGIAAARASNGRFCHIIETNG